MAKKKSDKQEPTRSLGQEIWGLVSVALGLLVLISLVSRAVGRPEILGPIFGAMLSRGLNLLLGAPAALLVPAAIITVGWRQIRGYRPTVRGLLTWAVVIAEVSALFALHNIRYVERGTFDFEHNYLGNSLTYLLHYVFGPHPLGPYFLLAVAIVVSVLVAFRIDIRTLATWIATSARTSIAWIVGVLARMKARAEA
ncbi:MAG: hypothetical protein GF331_18245, partial [Chitinivibrionales bacterium]|nr:hypothetical protein [Chitinivibrionales bacterium]